MKFSGEKYSRCLICDKARMKQVISHRVVSRSEIIGQRWFADYSGPFTPSVGKGNIYLIIFIDDSSGYIVLYFSKTKSDNEALKTLKQFNADYLVRVRAGES